MREPNAELAKPKRAWRRRMPGAPVLTYFVRAETLGLIKVGSAWDPWERVYRLQIGSPDKLKLIGIIPYDIERVVHDRFAAHRSHGEWFHPVPELLAYIEARAVDYWAWLRTQGPDINTVMMASLTEQAPA